MEITVVVNKQKGEQITIPTLQEVTYDEYLTLSSIALPEGWSWDNPNIVPTVNNNGYKATYTPKDSLNYDYSNQNLNPTLTLKVNKKDPTYETPSKIVVPYGTQLKDITLPAGFYFEDTGKVGDIGTHTYKVTYKPENENYNSVTGIEIEVEVEKANPEIATPDDIILEEQEGLTLGDIKLPEGWSWVNPDQEVTSTGSYQAIYTPKDKDHYNTVIRDVYIGLTQEGTLPPTEQERVESPETSDNIPLWITLFTISFTSLTGVGLYLRKRYN